jgi:hypothetical protein
MRTTRILVSTSLLTLSSGCIIVDDRQRGTSYQGTTSYEVSHDIVFEYARNVNQTCSVRDDTWRVAARELGEEGTATCSEDIVFRDLAPGSSFTFDIEGYQNGQLCAQGSCIVTVESGTNAADCSREMQYFCRY